MSDSRKSVIWPVSQPLPEVKQLIYRFFALVDTNSQEVGPVLADEIFTQDGVLITANAIFQGAASKTPPPGLSLKFSMLFTELAFRDIAIQRGCLDDGESSTAYNLESLCERRTWHGYLFSW
ncbi:hypothetical protein BDV27DRAFT_149472 [Aspergillus caelatus]|uniref:SnoaL-like domain-containing protein n=1 Tax=Aspergillus caelatus TaxID=61420 RepID=A0A5N6ZPL3_9EURO|nr:uncharacterized protein BDV27DRAFT_149472 [Aspergillus caelatus]KAE8359561.1 hypothetical protein BDV27DRAFT_149472 [Aspergillus caelatus]